MALFSVCLVVGASVGFGVLLADWWHRRQFVRLTPDRMMEQVYLYLELRQALLLHCFGISSDLVCKQLPVYEVVLYDENASPRRFCAESPFLALKKAECFVLSHVDKQRFG